MVKLRRAASALSALSLSVALATLTACSNGELEEYSSTDDDAEVETEIIGTVTEDVTVYEEAPAEDEASACDVLGEFVAGEGRELSDCDGAWAHAFTPQSDDNVYYMLNGNEWVELEPDGSTFTGFSCYDVEAYASEGAPAFITENMIACD